MMNNNIIISALLSLFSLLCDMKNNAKNKNKKRQTEGAIMITFDGLNPDDINFAANAIADVTKKFSSNIKRVLKGESNATIDMLELFAEALGRKVVVLTIPDSPALVDLVKKIGEETPYWWTVSGANNPQAVWAAFDRILGVSLKGSIADKKNKNALAAKEMPKITNLEKKLKSQMSFDDKLVLMTAILASAKYRDDIDLDALDDLTGEYLFKVLEMAGLYKYGLIK